MKAWMFNGMISILSGTCMESLGSCRFPPLPELKIWMKPSAEWDAYLGSGLLLRVFCTSQHLQTVFKDKPRAFPLAAKAVPSAEESQSFLVSWRTASALLRPSQKKIELKAQRCSAGCAAGCPVICWLRWRYTLKLLRSVRSDTRAVPLV